MYENQYWKLDDGTIWSAASAANVPDTDEAYRAWLAVGNTPARAANKNGIADAAGLREALLFYGLPLGELTTPDELQKQFTDAIQKRLDDFAKTRNDDSIMSVATIPRPLTRVSPPKAGTPWKSATQHGPRDMKSWMMS